MITDHGALRAGLPERLADLVLRHPVEVVGPEPVHELPEVEVDLAVHHEGPVVLDRRAAIDHLVAAPDLGALEVLDEAVEYVPRRRRVGAEVLGLDRVEDRLGDRRPGVVLHLRDHPDADCGNRLPEQVAGEDIADGPQGQELAGLVPHLVDRGIPGVLEELPDLLVAFEFDQSVDVVDRALLLSDRRHLVLTALNETVDDGLLTLGPAAGASPVEPVGVVVGPELGRCPLVLGPVVDHRVHDDLIRPAEADPEVGDRQVVLALGPGLLALPLPGQLELRVVLAGRLDQVQRRVRLLVEVEVHLPALDGIGSRRRQVLRKVDLEVVEVVARPVLKGDLDLDRRLVLRVQRARDPEHPGQVAGVVDRPVPTPGDLEDLQVPAVGDPADALELVARLDLVGLLEEPVGVDAAAGRDDHRGLHRELLEHPLDILDRRRVVLRLAVHLDVEVEADTGPPRRRLGVAAPRCGIRLVASLCRMGPHPLLALEREAEVAAVAVLVAVEDLERVVDGRTPHIRARAIGPDHEVGVVGDVVLVEEVEELGGGVFVHGAQG